MAKVQVLDSAGNKVNEISVPGGILDAPLKEHLLYESVINYRANQRSGSAATKTRAMVRGGGRKPWRQKGTGRARAGSTRSPIWRKGGVTFGPSPRSYAYSMPKKARRNALKSALSMKLNEKQLVILDAIEFKEPKTKEGVKFLEGLKLDSALVVDNHENKNMFLSLRNIPKVKAIDFSNLNVYDVLNFRSLVFSQKAFESLMEKLK
jgi:large subunit ribosomal protein L4